MSVSYLDAPIAVVAPQDAEAMNAPVVTLAQFVMDRVAFTELQTDISGITAQRVNLLDDKN